jgi:Uma2 family endonuclease
MEPAYKLLTVKEFLDSCPNDQRHYQLFDGVMVAMAPPGQSHQIIQMNLAYELGVALRANHPECTLHGDAGIAPAGVHGRDHFEADIVLTCAPADPAARGMIAEPLLIIEILSPSTERDDLFVKLPVYQGVPSLREILYVETQRVGATIYRRNEAGWTAIAVSGDDRLRLETVGLDIALAALYRGIPGLGL